jgi:hypothetical protein
MPGTLAEHALEAVLTMIALEKQKRIGDTPDRKQGKGRYTDIDFRVAVHLAVTFVVD